MTREVWEGKNWSDKDLKRPEKEHFKAPYNPSP